jgi:hypothetical protein
MAASDGPKGDERRSRPDGSAWAEAQRQVRDRNDEARRVGKQQRQDEERRVQAAERAEQKRGDVYR